MSDTIRFNRRNAQLLSNGVSFSVGQVDVATLSPTTTKLKLSSRTDGCQWTP